MSRKRAWPLVSGGGNVAYVLVSDRERDEAFVSDSHAGGGASAIVSVLVKEVWPVLMSRSKRGVASLSPTVHDI